MKEQISMSNQMRLQERINTLDESFCSNPAQYDWKNLGKREIIVPYNCDSAGFVFPRHHTDATPHMSGKIRWEKHRVWVVEGTLHKGESNVLPRRRFYLDEDSWKILMGEGYDDKGKLVKCYMLCCGTIPNAGHKGRWYPV
jgi:hypothetical protein